MAKTKALISCLVTVQTLFAFVFAYAKSRFSHDAAQTIAAGRYSSVGSDVAWESRGTAIDPPVRHIFS